MIKRVLLSMLLMVLLCAATGAECACAEDVTPLSRLTYLNSENALLAPMPDGSLSVRFYSDDAWESAHLEYLRKLDWNNVRQYDPESRALLDCNGVAMDPLYPYWKLHGVRKLIPMDGRTLYLMEDGSINGGLVSAEDVLPPDLKGLKDAAMFCGYFYSEQVQQTVGVVCPVAVMEDGSVCTEFLPAEIAGCFADWKDIRELIPFSEAVFAIDGRGGVRGLIPKDDGVAAVRAEGPVRRLVFFDLGCAMLMEDGSVRMLEEIYNEWINREYLVDQFVPGNFEAAMQWTGLRDVAVLPASWEHTGEYDTYTRDGYVFVGLTEDGRLLMDGLEEADPELAGFVRDYVSAWTGVEQLPETAAAPAYMPDDYLRRMTYRHPLMVSDTFAGVINGSGGFNGVGEVNGERLWSVGDEWTDLVSLACAANHMVGLRADGTVVAYGRHTSMQTEVDAWRNITAVDAGQQFTVGLTEYGMVTYTGSSEVSARLARTWRDVIALDAAADHVVGLRADGTALSTEAEAYGACMEVLSWTHLADVAAGDNSRAAGILLDGSLVTTESVYVSDPDAFVNLSDIVFSDDVLYGLRSDGTVVASTEDAQEMVADWTQVVAIAGDGGAVMGLRTDGSIVYAGMYMDDDDLADMDSLGASAAGDDESFYWDYDALHDYEWRMDEWPEGDVLAAGDDFVVAVAADGSVYASANAPACLMEEAPRNPLYVCARGDRVLLGFEGNVAHLYEDSGVTVMENVARAELGEDCVFMLDTVYDFGGCEWLNITGAGAHRYADLQGMTCATEMIAGDGHVVALVRDGLYATVAGDNDAGQCNVGLWKNIRQLEAGSRHTVALMDNGSVSATGDNTYGQCDVSAWGKDVHMIAAGDRFTAALLEDGTVHIAGSTDDGLDQALAWKNIVCIAGRGSHLVGLDVKGRLHSTVVDLTDAVIGIPQGIEIDPDMLGKPALDMQYDTFDLGEACCIALLEDGTVRCNLAVLERYYDDYSECYSSYYVYQYGVELPLADKPVAMVCAVNGGAVLYEDGTVQAEQFPEAAQWSDVVLIDGNANVLAGLTSDGRVLVSGLEDASALMVMEEWPPVVSVWVDGKDIMAATVSGNVITTGSRNYSAEDWYGIVSIKDDVGRRSDGSGTSTSKETGSPAVACFNINREWVLLYADGTMSKNMFDAAYPVVQMENTGDCLVVQLQDGSILANYDYDIIRDVFNWGIALPRGVEKKAAPEEVLAESVPGTATFRPGKRLALKSSYVYAVLADGRVVRKGSDQYECDPDTGEWYVSKRNLTILDPTLFYDVVDISSTHALRADGVAIALDHTPARPVSDQVTGQTNIVRLVPQGALLEGGVFVPTQNADYYAIDPEQWRDLVDVQGWGIVLVGLRSDGTLVGINLDPAVAEEISRWRGITSMCAFNDHSSGQVHVAGLLADGTVRRTDLHPGEKQYVTEPLTQIVSSGSDVYGITENGEVKCLTLSSQYLYEEDVVEYVCDYDVGIGRKADGWLVFTVSYDAMSNRYYDWNVNTINVDTLKGVTTE